VAGITNPRKLILNDRRARNKFNLRLLFEFLIPMLVRLFSRREKHFAPEPTHDVMKKLVQRSEITTCGLDRHPATG
jgi:hypothetical protein